MEVVFFCKVNKEVLAHILSNELEETIVYDVRERKNRYWMESCGKKG